ncbi:carbamoyl-phosphate synthase S chain [Micractinium conductrix]|uniref:Carbamoyl phosphate synthase small chain, chloroplastic n=1 Tax=Micractinium conductrix TaxID=554055 RepID=A0A2P6V415_9CHLO|nr:carbamoyl-phosphate synthase S chain [Micractinium conductrix]|eukprot:PSC68830.1 carbamoyl-phosphate synthase S chain [Micractinium conductrix]
MAAATLGHTAVAGCCKKQAPLRPAGFRGTPCAAPSSARVLLRKSGQGRRAERLHAAVVPAALKAPWEGTTPARLVLEDGSVWHGTAFGHTGVEVGEVVFNTSLTGYQEILTDPSYKGQFVVFTYPHLGNVGINPEDMESSKVHLGGVIARDLSCVVSNYRANMSLDEYLKEQKVMGIAGVDTRAITRRLRVDGCLNGAICTDASISDEDLVARTKSWTIVGKDLIKEVTCSEPYKWSDPTGEEWEFAPAAKAVNGAEPLKVVAYDYGIKLNILRRLTSFGCKVTVVPADYPAEKVLAMNPDGIFFSNGPGDPSAVPYAVENAKQVLGKVPVFGICMGHQVLGQAFGGKTFKLKFGHHGGNHPLRHTPTGRIEISAQNHNFAVDTTTLPDEVEISLINLNDGTCAGMYYPSLQALTVQSHPEASPGPHDSDVAFVQFIDMMKASKKRRFCLQVTNMAPSIETVKAAREQLREVISKTHCQPILIRLAWHDSGTYSVEAAKTLPFPKAGGATGSIRFKPEMSHGANNGLPVALTLLTPVKEAHPTLGWADLIQLGSAVAVETAGGPFIPLRLGRKDAESEEHCTPDGRLPAAAAPFPDASPSPAQHLKNVFYRMGLSDRDIVALSGAHTVGRARPDRSGFGKESTKYTKDGPGAPGGSSWTAEWLKFDNSYFTDIKNPTDPELLVLETDACIFTDEGFKPHAEKYAADQAAFFADYVESHLKLSELGVEWDGEPLTLTQ